MARAGPRRYSGRRMKIVEARVIVTCPGRNFVTLKIVTESGLHGIGDATLNGRELAVASYLTEHVIPCLLGRDAHRIEDIWQFLYRGAYWRRGPVTMSAIAETADEVQRYIELGYLAIRAQTGIPGMAATYGVSTDKMFYEPADAQTPTENLWSTVKYLEHVPRLFECLRSRFGAQPHLLHDVHHRLTPIEAAHLGKALEPYRLFWLEDPTPAENQANFRLIRAHTVTPLAVGEVFNSIWDCKQLIEEQLIDYIRTTVVHAGGITHLRRIAAFADLHGVRTGCHGATDLS